jgi:hypothetical protein
MTARLGGSRSAEVAGIALDSTLDLRPDFVWMPAEPCRHIMIFVGHTAINSLNRF